ncbi:MAG: hypothetical protein AVDCRST_MAG18-635 [uncultured Thermomicrobiales bacterium]|uniref:Mycothiol-dependent maleylpyruvate isomerase metal-binding domain-containing protein n=1 Tax=uncultured Thermomicrobiales bacterium TaxID=1645740 RepID=A0A6J4UPX3_9BACT|nr:MAG: hypothetical protein AVDCRST_MAG18-635 [uncultured Thermomicrobiales bacterium]
MANREEITAAIQQGIANVESTFGALSDAQLATQVHAEEAGWDARDILAHLAGRREVYAMMRQAATGANPFAGISSFHDFNRERVAERDGLGRDELLTEFRAVHEDLLAQLDTIPDDQLAAEVALGPRRATLGDLLLGSGGTHSSGHAKDVAQAVGLRGTAG